MRRAAFDASAKLAVVAFVGVLAAPRAVVVATVAVQQVGVVALLADVDRAVAAEGRRPVLDVVPRLAVRNLIRQGKVEQVYSIMQTGTARGMQTMEQALAELVMRRVITQEAALGRTSRPDQLIGLLERGGFTATDPGAPAPPLQGGLRVAGS